MGGVQRSDGIEFGKTTVRKQCTRKVKNPSLSSDLIDKSTRSRARLAIKRPTYVFKTKYRTKLSSFEGKIPTENSRDVSGILSRNSMDFIQKFSMHSTLLPHLIRLGMRAICQKAYVCFTVLLLAWPKRT